MSQFLEFNSTRETRAGQFARGNPLHDGVVPRRARSLEAIHINGDDIGASRTTVELIHRSLVETRRAQRHGMGVDAIGFVAIYNTPKFHGRFARSDTPNSLEVTDDQSLLLKIAKDQNLLDPHTPLRLGHGPMERAYLRHSVQPIETDSKEQLYVHKIGVAGPLCISSLAKALDIYHCDIYKPYASLTLTGQTRSFERTEQ